MLIDVVYDSGAQLIWSGETEPNDLFTDMFVQGLSTMRVVVESDDLTPFDPVEEEKLSKQHFQPDTHISHHAASSPKVEEIAYSGPRDDTVDTFAVMKGETAAFRDLDFAVRRAVSRLIEISGSGYVGATRK